MAGAPKNREAKTEAAVKIIIVIVGAIVAVLLALSQSVHWALGVLFFAVVAMYMLVLNIGQTLKGVLEEVRDEMRAMRSEMVSRTRDQ